MVLVDSRPSRNLLGFWLLAGVFGALMAFTTLPTPIYPTYEKHDGFATVMVTVIFAVYGIGVMGGLYFAGHLSDQVGRRRPLACAVALTAVSSVIFIASPSVTALLAARFISGVGVGILTPTATAMLGELWQRAEPDKDPSTGSTLATSVNMGGLALGPALGGVFVQWLPSPMRLPYVVFLGVCLVAAGAMLAVPETRRPTPPAERAPYRPQRAVVGEEQRGTYRSAAVTAAAAFSVNGILTATTAVFLASALGKTSPLFSGLAVFTFMTASALAQVVIGQRLGDVARVRAGVLIMVPALVIVSVAAGLGSLVLFLTGGVLAGGGAGLLFQSAVAVAGEVSAEENRGGNVAGIFLSAYAGMSLPVIAAGVVTQWASVSTVLGVFALVVAMVIVVATRSFMVPRGPQTRA